MRDKTKKKQKKVNNVYQKRDEDKDRFPFRSGVMGLTLFLGVNNVTQFL